MAIDTRTVSYQDGETRLEGLLAVDDIGGKPRPAVLVFHAWGGRDDFACEKARELAGLGYAAFAVDMYGDARLGVSKEENAGLMQPFMDDRMLLEQRALAALAAVQGLDCVDADRVAAIGFCFGGLCALDLARSGADVCGVVSFHGLFKPRPQPAANIPASILMLHGWDDPMVPPEDVMAIQQEFTQAGADWQLHSYGHTVHAFTNPQANDPGFGTVFKPQAASRAWRSMRFFLEEVFS